MPTGLGELDPQKNPNIEINPFLFWQEHPLTTAIQKGDAGLVANILNEMGENAQKIILSYDFDDDETPATLMKLACGNRETGFRGNLEILELLWNTLGDKAFENAFINVESSGDGLLEHALWSRSSLEIIKFIFKKMENRAKEFLLPKHKKYSTALCRIFAYNLTENEDPQKMLEIFNLILEILGSDAEKILMAKGVDKEAKPEIPLKYLYIMLTSSLSCCTNEQADLMRSLLTAQFLTAIRDQADTIVLAKDESNRDLLAYACCDRSDHIPSSATIGFRYSGYKTVKAFLTALTDQARQSVLSNIEYYLNWLLTPLAIGHNYALSPVERFKRSDNIFQAFIECFPNNKNDLIKLYQEKKKTLVCTPNEEKIHPLIQVQSAYQYKFGKFEDLDLYKAEQSKVILQAALDSAPDLVLGNELKEIPGALLHACQYSGPHTVKVMLEALNVNSLPQEKIFQDCIQAMVLRLPLKALNLKALKHQLSILQKLIDIFITFFHIEKLTAMETLQEKINSEYLNKFIAILSANPGNENAAMYWCVRNFLKPEKKEEKQSDPSDSSASTQKKSGKRQSDQKSDQENEPVLKKQKRPITGPLARYLVSRGSPLNSEGVPLEQSNTAAPMELTSAQTLKRP